MTNRDDLAALASEHRVQLDRWKESQNPILRALAETVSEITGSAHRRSSSYGPS